MTVIHEAGARRTGDLRNVIELWFAASYLGRLR
jgi:hypothetical protein